MIIRRDRFLSPGAVQPVPYQADMLAQIVQFVGIGQRYADLAHIELDPVQLLQQLLAEVA